MGGSSPVAVRGLGRLFDSGRRCGHLLPARGVLGPPGADAGLARLVPELPDGAPADDLLEPGTQETAEVEADRGVVLARELEDPDAAAQADALAGETHVDGGGPLPRDPAEHGLRGLRAQLHRG